MNFIGEIVEHDVIPAVAPTAPSGTRKGFPALKKFDTKRTSRFKKVARAPPAEAPSAKPQVKEPKEELSEAEKIHRENLDKLLLMTEDEIEKERLELLQALDPKTILSLLKRAEDRLHSHVEGHDDDGWIGGGKKGVSLPSLNAQEVNKALGVKSVRFGDDEVFEHQEITENEQDDHEDPSKAITGIEVPDEYPVKEEEEGDDEIAPEGYQIVPEEHEHPEMHFPKPKVPTEDPDLDLNDPKFYDKLHEKYFADLPRETSKLAWMTEPIPEARITTYEAISDMRFDFKGELVKLNDEASKIPTHLGLHHHSENPQLAGYTIAELVHLSRSVVPTQRCLGIQMLGRILHRLGLHKYDIMPIVEDETNPVLENEINQVMSQFEGLMWDLVEELRVIESLTEAADEKKTRNLSVRNYAIEALWLWRQGGGRPKNEKTEEDVIADQLQDM